MVENKWDHLVILFIFTSFRSTSTLTDLESKLYFKYFRYKIIKMYEHNAHFLDSRSFLGISATMLCGDALRAC